MKIYTRILIAMAIASSLYLIPRSIDVSGNVFPESYTIYEALVGEVLPDNAVGELLISEATGIDFGHHYIGRYGFDWWWFKQANRNGSWVKVDTGYVLIDAIISFSTAKSYRKNNRGSKPHIATHPFFDNRVIFTRAVVDSLLEAEGVYESALFELYPNFLGEVTFSEVGFNKAHTEALVYDSYECIGNCGRGTYYLLRLINDKWVIIGGRMLWIS